MLPWNFWGTFAILNFEFQNFRTSRIVTSFSETSRIVAMYGHTGTGSGEDLAFGVGAGIGSGPGSIGPNSQPRHGNP